MVWVVGQNRAAVLDGEHSTTGAVVILSITESVSPVAQRR